MDDGLKLLRDKCLLFNQFLIDNTGIPAQFFEETNRLIEKAYQELDIRTLKSASRDIDMQMKEIPLFLAMELKKLFKDQLNIDFDVVEKLRMKAIDKIAKKGKITNEEEYRLLLSRIDEIYDKEGMEDDVKSLNNLLSNYQK